MIAGISRVISYLNPLAYVYPSAEDFDFGDEGLPLLMGGAGLPEGLRVPPLGEAHEVGPLVLPPPAPDAVVVALPDAAPDAGVPVAPAVAPTFLQKVATKIVACWNKVMYREVPVVLVRILTPEQERRQTMVNNISVMVVSALLFKLCGRDYNHDIVKIIATRVANGESFYDVFLEQHPDITSWQQIQVRFFISRYFYSQELIQKTVGGLLETLCPNIDRLQNSEEFNRQFLGILQFINGLLNVQRDGVENYIQGPDGTLQGHVSLATKNWREFRNRPKVVGDFVNRIFSFVPTEFTYFDYFTNSHYRFVHYFGVAAECVLGKTIGKIFSKCLSLYFLDQIKNYLKYVDGNDVIFHLRLAANQLVLKHLVLDFTDSLKAEYGMTPTAPVLPGRAEDIPPPVPVGASTPELRRQFRHLIWQAHALLSIESLPDEDLSRRAVEQARDAAIDERERLEQAMGLLGIDLQAPEMIDPMLQKIRARMNSDWIAHMVNSHFRRIEPLVVRRDPRISVETQIAEVTYRALDQRIARRWRPVVVAARVAGSATSRAQRLWGWIRRDRAPARPELGYAQILDYRETVTRRGAHLATQGLYNLATRHVEMWDAAISGGIGALEHMLERPPVAAPVA